jgi:hypothetical protein
MWCTLQLRGQIHSPYFSSTPMYSVVTLTLYLQKWTNIKSVNKWPNLSFSQKLSICHIFEHLKYIKMDEKILTKKERVHWLRSSVKVAYGTKHLVWRTNNNLPKDSFSLSKLTVGIHSRGTLVLEEQMQYIDLQRKVTKIILIIGSLF